MGYYMSNREADFKIKSENIPGALEAMRKLATQTNRGSGGSWSSKGKTSSSFAWVDTEKFANAKTLKDALHEWRWEVEFMAEDIITIYFEGEKLGDDSILFDALAPFVEPGSYIEMSGEDNAIWRWSFDGKTCVEESPYIDWEGDCEIVEALLKEKEILPTLIGIHPGLDKRIAEVLKK